jgi:hypothetical protein
MFFKAKNAYQFGLCGTLEFCLSVKQILKTELDIEVLINKRHKNRKSNNYNLTFGGNMQVIKCLLWLYKDAPFYLERKYIRFQTLLGQYANNKTKRSSILFKKRVIEPLRKIGININL